MKLSLALPQNSVEALFYMLLKLAFWQACSKMSARKCKNRPSGSNQSCVACFWWAPSVPLTGWNSSQMPAIWQHQHCLILYSSLASINNMVDSPNGGRALRLVHVLTLVEVYWNDQTIFSKFEKNLTIKRSMGPEIERAVRNVAHGLKGTLKNVLCKCWILRTYQ